MLLDALNLAPRLRFAQLPTPLHPLPRLTEHLGGPRLWIKRDDLTGLAGGGNKTRKLEFVVADAVRAGADTLVTVGAVQSNHTRQTAAAAARAGLRCVLLHNAWAPEPGPGYRTVGNVLLSDLLGAELYADDTPRHIDDPGRIDELVDHLRREGHKPYRIPGGASEHPLGGHGYAACAAEIERQGEMLGIRFDVIVHCTGSSSTQSGLLAGLAALENPARVIGVADDDEREEKCRRVLRLANETLATLGLRQRVTPEQVEVVVVDDNPYGAAGQETIDAIHLLARTEGLIADPVYEGRAVRALVELVGAGRFTPDQNVLLLHLGGSPAVHAWAGRLAGAGLRPLPRVERYAGSE
jgi:1-aminocyclopropane-1-carboxylate deaminase